jgi:TonB family protein
MTTRLFLCLAVSASIHALVLVQPWTLMATSKTAEQKAPSIPIKLVDQEQLKQLLVPQEEDAAGESREGISFETEGDVSTDYLDLLKVKIFDAWVYPEDAVRNDQEGIVKIIFTLDGTGRVVDIGILQSSGYPGLDAAALYAIKKASPFGPFTNDIAAGELKITGSFCYVLD